MNCVRFRWLLTGFSILCATSGLRAAEPKLELVVQTGHADSINSFALSADGTRVLTASQDKTAILWDAVTGRKLRTLHGFAFGVKLSRDGKRLLTNTPEGAVLWDSATGAKVRTFGHRIRYSELSRDGRLVATESYDNTAILWNAETGEKLQTFSEVECGG